MSCVYHNIIVVVYCKIQCMMLCQSNYHEVVMSLHNVPGTACTAL